jgi:Flp pilus assembly protein TadG
MDLLGVQADLAKAQGALALMADRIAALETQTAKDVNAIADKVIAAVLPEVQGARASVDQLAVVVSASVQETLVLVRRIDGAGFTFKLGPEVA